jgi:hypothetical protein
VNNHCNAGQSALEPGGIAHIPDKVAEARMVEARGAHVMLLKFVAAENHQALRVIVPQHDFHKLLAE